MSAFNPHEERQIARDFVLHYLKDDGVFVTRLLSVNSSDLVVTEIINQLWIRFKTANRLYSSSQNSNDNVINTSTLGTNINYQNDHTSNNINQRHHLLYQYFQIEQQKMTNQKIFLKLINHQKILMYKKNIQQENCFVCDPRIIYISINMYLLI
jgi:hypothetical protein